MTSFNKAVVRTFHSQDVKRLNLSDDMTQSICHCADYMPTMSTLCVHGMSHWLALASHPQADSGDVWIADSFTCGSGSVKYFKSTDGV